MSKVIFFEFAGRQANMEAQKPFIQALLDQNKGSEFHLWDLTRTPSDAAYIREWAATDERISVMSQFHTGHPIRCTYPNGMRRPRGYPRCECMIHKPPYEQPYKFYAKNWYDADGHSTTFVKFDDDVIWMDVEKFPEVLEFLETRPNAVASANVVNNAVCAKYEPGLRDSIREISGIGGLLPEYDHDWWELHTKAWFARDSHGWFQNALRRNHEIQERLTPVRTRPGERISINFIAFKAPTMRRLAQMMQGSRLGDEGTVDMALPWIVRNFRVAHLTFGPQEAGLGKDINKIRNLYKEEGQS